MYKVKELREKTPEELKKILEELRKDLMLINMKIKNRMQVENYKKKREIRRTIARILTILREKGYKW